MKKKKRKKSPCGTGAFVFLTKKNRGVKVASQL